MDTARRARIASLTAFAEQHPEVSGLALTGSLARRAEDSYSDIDMFIAYRDGASRNAVMESWTDHLKSQYGVAHYFDLQGNGACYRAFLLEDGTEIDVGFSDEEDFRSAGGAAFEVLFGTARPATTSNPPQVDERSELGHLWHHVLHTWSCAQRGQTWQSLHWLTALRDLHATRLCRDHGIPNVWSKGIDRLPAPIQDQLRDTMPASLAKADILRALDVLTRQVIEQIESCSPNEQPLARVLGAFRVGTLHRALDDDSC